MTHLLLKGCATMISRIGIETLLFKDSDNLGWRGGSDPISSRFDGAQRQDCARPVDGKRQATEPNSTSTGVGVLTSVLNFNLPFEGWIRNTAIESVF